MASSAELAGLLAEITAEAESLQKAAAMLRAVTGRLAGDAGMADRLAALDEDRSALAARLDAALAEAPPPDDLLKSAAQAYCTAGFPERAVALLSHAIVRRPDWSDAYAWYGELVHLAGMADAVQEELQRRVTAEPGDAVAHRTLLAVLAKAGRYDAAGREILRHWGRGAMPFGRFGDFAGVVGRSKDTSMWQGGLTLHDAAMLHTLACRAARPGAVFVELGSWYGMSTAILGDVAAAVGGTVFAIDTWAGSETNSLHADVVKGRNVFDTFCTNMERFGLLRSTVIPVMSATSRCAALLAPETVDLLFIDADHRYAAVRDDIALWAPKVRPGGLVCGHDCEQRYATLPAAVRQRVDAELEQNHLTGIGHPGVIRAVHEAFDGAAELAGPGSSVWWVER